ncbi:hypothetical protein K458DRAFT_53706 [Lentithecium fluviatile CBS 122367]|uniref:Uncharacterized protein n=1 Tax=Lentithecium fluviatile CBS 122367 TaxID=1168545 RepID=A0A6G1IX56_9PLEO|nr:hypothetical protein K458DRAFT_53706 [Lentithecium fluviatile CBS 122367]
MNKLPDKNATHPFEMPKAQTSRVKHMQNKAMYTITKLRMIPVAARALPCLPSPLHCSARNIHKNRANCSYKADVG